MSVARLLVVLCAAATLLPAASGHGAIEASELEILLLTDEGTDSIEPYGGFDINAVFIGFAHDPTVGVGSAGDGLYLRAELYGLPENSAPAGQGTWTVTFTVATPAGPIQRTLSTADGTEFTSDFDSLLIEVDTDERAVHALRGFIAFASISVVPGDAVGVTRVESRKDGDLRDVAPGGIPVPGTNGLAEYPDPMAIPGKGIVVASVAAEAPVRYLKPATLTADDDHYTVTVASALKDGGQHIEIKPRVRDGWTFDLRGPSSISVQAGQNATFEFIAAAQPDAGDLELDLLTDVGGRVPVILTPRGLLTAGETEVQNERPATAPAPAAGLLLAVGALALASLARRRAQ